MPNEQKPTAEKMRGAADRLPVMAVVWIDKCLRGGADAMDELAKQEQWREKAEELLREELPEPYTTCHMCDGKGIFAGTPCCYCDGRGGNWTQRHEEIAKLLGIKPDADLAGDDEQAVKDPDKESALCREHKSS